MFGDTHTIPGQDLSRATLLSKLILDVKPDVVINLGDQADMQSLCSYDRGTKNFIGRTYKNDIDASLEFNDRLFGPLKKAKKKLPRFVFIEGNHEERIKRALKIQTELEGTISLDDLELKENYHDVIEYVGSTPGTIGIDGILYSHYFVTGVAGKPSTSLNSGCAYLSKFHRSVTQGHSHLFDYCTKPTADGSRINALTAGCFLDSNLEWAGQANKLWWRGVFIKYNVEDGNYDLEAISLDRLRKEYG